MLLSADQPTRSGSRQNLENLPWKKVQLLTAWAPAIRVGNSLFRSSLFWSRQSLKKSDCELVALVALYKRVTLSEWLSSLFTKKWLVSEWSNSQPCRQQLLHTQRWAPTILSRQRDHVFRPQSCLLLQHYSTIFVVDTPSRHRDLIMFRIFLWSLRLYYVVVYSRCRVIVVTKLKNCRVPGSVNTSNQIAGNFSSFCLTLFISH